MEPVSSGCEAYNGVTGWTECGEEPTTGGCEVFNTSRGWSTCEEEELRRRNAAIVSGIVSNYLLLDDFGGVTLNEDK